MAKEKSAKKETEDWMQKKWRPMMAIMYMVVCIFDFIIFPIGFTIVQFWEIQPENDKFRQWEPLTLVGAGLFHMAMGAVLGITAWSRGQEKIAGVATNGFNTSQNVSSTFGPTQTGGFTPTSSYNSPTAFQTAGPRNSGYSGYEQTTDTFTVAPILDSKGRKAPVMPPDPEI